MSIERYHSFNPLEDYDRVDKINKTIKSTNDNTTFRNKFNESDVPDDDDVWTWETATSKWRPKPKTNVKHHIDSTSDHYGVSGAVQNNFTSFDASGLPKDSGSNASSFDPAGTASGLMSTHTSAYDHTKIHDAATAGTGISVTGQEIANTDTGSSAVASHTSAYDHSKLHNQAHGIDSGTDHNGVSGATENNFIAFNASGLPKDSGSKAGDFATAGHTHAQLHDAATAGDGISVVGQQVSNSDRGSTAVSGHESAYNHSNYNTAYGWGDHASAGYFVKASDDMDDISDGATYKKTHNDYTDAEVTKLSGIEAGADVTDATNVAAAGAVMDGDFSANGLMTRTGAGTYSSFKYNYSASAAPGVNDDNTAGYAVGSAWIDTTADKSYTCVDATTGAAVWKEQGGSGGVTSVTATSPIASSGGSTPNITISATPSFTDVTLTGVLKLPNTTSDTVGVIKFNDKRFFHNKGLYNVYVGEESGNYTLSGNSNTLCGYSVGNSLTSGSSNTVFGAWALQGSVSGNYNSGIGTSVFASLTSGGYNVAIGTECLYSLTTGSFNVAIGKSTMPGCAGGSYNTAVGKDAGAGITSGNYNVLLGFKAGYSAGNISDKLYIENSNSTTPLIGGDFANDLAGINMTIANIKSTLHIGGSFGAKVTAKSANFTADATTFTYLCTTGAGGITATLPAASGCTDRIYNFKKVDSGAGALTIDGNASETIDGSLTYSLASQWDKVTIQCDGSNWYVI